MRNMVLFGVMVFVTSGLTRCQGQSAPPLTAVNITGVQSPAGNEAIPSGALSTRRDHGGNYIDVTVVERGYSSWRSAQLNGANMQLVSRTPVVTSGRVTGWVNRFRYSGFTRGGRFVFRATSATFPFRTLSTYINIR